ncbi:MAG: hypothetical protein OXT09_23405, partial [Myxococcales bacterium]|nr:hypothetical protein [Myxococcales bacterium]
VGDSSRLSVRIALDGGGRVTDATVSPASLGQGPAGGCIATAVRKMRFGKQPQAVAFRVPLTARRNP